MFESSFTIYIYNLQEETTRLENYCSSGLSHNMLTICLIHYFVLTIH